MEAFRCHVCGCGLAEPPWGEGGTDPTWDICPCCGCEFDYEDATADGVLRHREHWLASGGKWFNEKLKPQNWQLAEQVKRIPTRLPAGIT